MEWYGHPVTRNQIPRNCHPRHNLQIETMESSGSGAPPAEVVFDEEVEAALGEASAYFDRIETNTNNGSSHQLEMDFDYTLLDSHHPLSQSHHPHHYIQIPPSHILPPHYTNTNNYPLQLAVRSTGDPHNHQPAQVPRVFDDQINKNHDKNDDRDDDNNSDQQQPAGAEAGGRPKKRREASQIQDHILAERKRRELLSTQFISLSAIVPGLKKTDKASVLGEAIKYMKELKEKVKALEEVAAKRTVAVVRTSQVVVVDQDGGVVDDDNDTSSSVEDNNTGAGGCSGSLPEIEVKVTSDKAILIKICCESWKGVLPKLFLEMEKLGLNNVINCSAVHFGTLALDITILAQMEEDVDVNLKDVIRSLGATVSRPSG